VYADLVLEMPAEHPGKHMEDRQTQEAGVTPPWDSTGS
jgi:hypothetical protein